MVQTHRRPHRRSARIRHIRVDRKQLNRFLFKLLYFSMVKYKRKVVVQHQIFVFSMKRELQRSLICSTRRSMIIIIMIFSRWQLLRNQRPIKFDSIVCIFKTLVYFHSDGDVFLV
ncbi:hypothetical protein HanXRQr2_Chr07g0295231 [Helianthus annuus]|uniref:Uncharacterized protein n=1 Tax=Helianthus annuus TaxID=4232 RepID=A0A9K3NGE1_HELAN|nr:hypothetical protein HanXRQr2_Chr07g0295231 [Helianthus annuus]KAJ0904745.1 hypothetical protein HanPSC8_Chr07g0285801 [Helianthus annuus]